MKGLITKEQMARFLNDSSIIQNDQMDIFETDEDDESAHISDFDLKSLLNSLLSNMLRPFGGLFIINIGQYIKLYKGDLPTDDGMFQNSDTADFHAFIKNNIDIKIDVENLDEAISRYLYLSFLKSNYKQIDFKWLMCAYMGREKSINTIDDFGDKACLQNLLLLNRLDKDGERW